MPKPPISPFATRGSLAPVSRAAAVPIVLAAAVPVVLAAAVMVVLAAAVPIGASSAMASPVYGGAEAGTTAPAEPKTPAASAATPRATLLPSGGAVAPPSAPPAVKAMIEAGNRIRRHPYRWGGGHRGWRSRGYDCSGSVSYVMHAAGLLDWALDSRGFMRWGAAGAGQWVRIYANREHVYAVIAGLRWDTSMTTEGDGDGPGWSEEMRSGHGFRLRHPLGLLQAEVL